MEQNENGRMHHPVLQKKEGYDISAEIARVLLKDVPHGKYYSLRSRPLREARTGRASFIDSMSRSLNEGWHEKTAHRISKEGLGIIIQKPRRPLTPLLIREAGKFPLFPHRPSLTI